MGGTSLADGIARAAQTGGATFLAGKQQAAKAVDAAEDAELAFNKYKLALRKGDEDSARKSFESFTDSQLKYLQITATRDAALARAQPKPLTPQQELAMRANIARLVDAQFKDVLPSSDPVTAAQQERDRQAYQSTLEANAGLPPLQVQSGSGGGAGNRPALSSFIN
jgi:hypothetical protein